jgi:hypothetical protein
MTTVGGAGDDSLPPMTWEQQRVLQYVMEKKLIPEYVPPPNGTADKKSAEAAAYQSRSEFFRGFGAAFAQLGTLPGELRFTLEPLHPLPDSVLESWLTKELAEADVSQVTLHAGLSALSRALFTSYGLGALTLFDSVQAPKDHPDLFLFDQMVGFLLWLDGGRRRNFWLGNQRDLVEVEQMPAPLKNLLVPSHSDHFSLGKSLFTRMVGPLMRERRYFEFDVAGIPTLRVESQRDLDAFADDLRNACQRAPLPISIFFRGQTDEHLLPDRSHLVKAGIALYSDVRDHSMVPSLYRKYDQFLGDPRHFRAFVSLLQDWSFCSDMVFGDPATYTTLYGEPYNPTPVPGNATATMTMHHAGGSQGARALEDIGPYTLWTVTGADGAVIDRYQKFHRPGHDSVRRNLILQHYGAPTSFIDVTRDVTVAEWFAFNRITVGPNGLTTSGLTIAPYRESAIFVFMVLDGLAPIVNTEQLTTAEEALRPHRQACAALGGAGNLYRNAASRFIGLKIKFGDAFRHEGLPTARHLFPDPDEDNALKVLLEHYAARYPWPDKLPVDFPVYWFPKSIPA